MSLLDDSVLALAAAVSVASVVVLVTFLTRYRKLTEEHARSSRLGKDIYDAMNARLSVMDARIIDLMAKVEIYVVKHPAAQPTERKSPPPTRQQPVMAQPTPLENPPITANITPITALQADITRSEERPEETNKVVLQTLLQGPKTSNQIMVTINRSREHTGRIMKLLYGKGLVTRNTDRTRPFVYQVTEAGRRYLENA